MDDGSGADGIAVRWPATSHIRASQTRMSSRMHGSYNVRVFIADRIAAAHPVDPAQIAAAEFGPPGETGSSHTSAHTGERARTAAPVPLKALTSLSWPPEPDEAIFDDPLMKEDAKPLRHAQLERIGPSHHPLYHDESP